MRLVGRAADATPADGYALAAAELRAGRRDEALAIVQQLVERGFDVAGALRKDRQVSPEQRYQVGFILVERRHPAGEEILTDLAGAGRNKIATMAKAKLRVRGLRLSGPRPAQLGCWPRSILRRLNRLVRSGQDQRVAGAQLLVAGRIDDVGGVAVDRDHGGAGEPAQVDLLERPARPRATRRRSGRAWRCRGREAASPAPARRGVAGAGRALGGQRLQDHLRPGAHVAFQVGGAAPQRNHEQHHTRQQDRHARQCRARTAV